MTTKKPFAQAGFLSYLQSIGDSTPMPDAPLSPPLAKLLFVSGNGGPLSESAAHLIQLLKGREAMLQAAFDTERVADELRRYQKFAKPGQPSPHIVRLRQQQGAVRQAASVAKQSFIKAAAAFVRTAGINVPERVALEVYITRWIDDNVPKNFACAI